MTKNPELYPGDVVEVRSFKEIVATLDSNGCLESLPFMPEMKDFCGKRYTVFCRLEKTCVEGFGARLIPNTVTLRGIYCDGSAHDDCQRYCPIIWKEAWLEPVHDTDAKVNEGTGEADSPVRSLRTKRDQNHYFCQSTELSAATRSLSLLGLNRWTLEFRSKNAGLRESFFHFWIPFIVRLKAGLFGLSSVQPVGTSDVTPVEVLDLKPGELVEVKRREEIALTLDRKGRNRGLSFTHQMLRFCGTRQVVKGRVERMILETTGEMKILKHTVMLEDVICDGHTVLGGCSRFVYNYWREAWLRRVDSGPGH